MSEHPSDESVFYGQNPELYNHDARNELRNDARESLMPPAQAEALVAHDMGIIERYQIADGGPFARALIDARRSAPDPEKKASWVAESKRVLQTDYGDKAGQVLADVNRMVRNDSQLTRLFKTSPAGDNPVVVRSLAARAVALRKAGKL